MSTLVGQAETQPRQDEAEVEGVADLGRAPALRGEAAGDHLLEQSRATARRMLLVDAWLGSSGT